MLYTLFTYDCVASHRDNTLLKFSDDTTVIGLITGVWKQHIDMRCLVW